MLCTTFSLGRVTSEDEESFRGEKGLEERDEDEEEWAALVLWFDLT